MRYEMREAISYTISDFISNLISNLFSMSDLPCYLVPKLNLLDMSRNVNSPSLSFVETSTNFNYLPKKWQKWTSQGFSEVLSETLSEEDFPLGGSRCCCPSSRCPWIVLQDKSWLWAYDFLEEWLHVFLCWETEAFNLHNGPLLENGLDTPEICNGRYGFLAVWVVMGVDTQFPLHENGQKIPWLRICCRTHSLNPWNAVLSLSCSLSLSFSRLLWFISSYAILLLFLLLLLSSSSIFYFYVFLLSLVFLISSCSYSIIYFSLIHVFFFFPSFLSISCVILWLLFFLFYYCPSSSFFILFLFFCCCFFFLFFLSFIFFCFLSLSLFWTSGTHDQWSLSRLSCWSFPISLSL